MDLTRQRLDLLRQLLVFLREDGVRLDQQIQRAVLRLDRRLAFLHVTRDRFAMRLEMVKRVPVSFGVAGLREQAQRSLALVS